MNFDGFDDLAAALKEFQEKVEDAEEQLDAAIDKGVATTAARVEGSAKRRAPVDTGNLRASINYQRVESGKYVVGTNAEYAEAVEKGTSAHTITADDGYLRFQVGGETLFRKSVNHPGTEPNPFLRPSLREHNSDLASDIEDAIEELFAEVFD